MKKISVSPQRDDQPRCSASRENTLRPLDEIIVEEFDHFADHLDDLGRLQRAYQAAKRQKQLVDYDDLAGVVAANA